MGIIYFLIKVNKVLIFNVSVVMSIVVVIIISGLYKFKLLKMKLFNLFVFI